MSQTVNYSSENKHCEGKNFSCSQQAMRTDRDFNEGGFQGHHTEKRTTEVTATTATAGSVQRPTGPTITAQQLANEQRIADARQEQFENQKEAVRDNLKSLERQLADVEADADKNAVKLAKLQAGHKKVELKEKEKLDKKEREVMAMAAKLSEKQQKALAEEREREEELRRAEEEADRLAQQKLRLISQQREAAQMRIQELANKRAEAERKYNELKNKKESDTVAFNIQIKEIKESETQARRNFEQLEARQGEAQRALEKLRKEFHLLQERFQTEQEAAQHKAEEAQRLRQRAAQLEQEAQAAGQRAGQMQGQLSEHQTEIERLRQRAAQLEQERRDNEFMVKKRQEEITTLQKVSQSTVQNEEEAARRAKELAEKHGMDLESARKEINKLMESERKIREEKERLEQNANRQPTAVAQGETVTDIYQHAQIKTENATKVETEPHITRDGEVVTEEGSKSIIDKIGDTISKIL